MRSLELFNKWGEIKVTGPQACGKTTHTFCIPSSKGLKALRAKKNSGIQKVIHSANYKASPVMCVLSLGSCPYKDEYLAEGNANIFSLTESY